MILAKPKTGAARIRYCRSLALNPVASVPCCLRRGKRANHV